MRFILIGCLLATISESYGQYGYSTGNYAGNPFSSGYYTGLPNTAFRNIDITVVTKGDTTISFKGSLYAGMDIIMVGKGPKLYKPQNTKEIVLNSFKGQDMRGFSTDSTWLFRVVEGKINMYSRVPLKGDKQATAIQKGDGEIVQLNMANLTKMIPEKERDLKLVDLFDQYKLQSIVKYYNKK